MGDDTPVVTYTYDPADNDRLTGITDPNGRTVTYNYDGNAGIDNIMDRVSSLSDDDGTIQSYTYLGLDTPVTFTDGNGTELSYLGTVGSAGGDAGDQYTGLDRFGRVIGQNWSNSSGGLIDSFLYGYDADSNVLYKKNSVNTSQSELYVYDSLNRLTNYSTGNVKHW